MFVHNSLLQYAHEWKCKGKVQSTAIRRKARAVSLFFLVASTAGTCPTLHTTYTSARKAKNSQGTKIFCGISLQVGVPSRQGSLEQ